LKSSHTVSIGGCSPAALDACTRRARIYANSFSSREARIPVSNPASGLDQRDDLDRIGPGISLLKPRQHPVERDDLTAIFGLRQHHTADARGLQSEQVVEDVRTVDLVDADEDARSVLAGHDLRGCIACGRFVGLGDRRLEVEDDGIGAACKRALDVPFERGGT
jgi:hypothetical protein